jgi:hypothetical protein
MIHRPLALAALPALALAALAGCGGDDGGGGGGGGERSGVVALLSPTYVDYDPAELGSEGSNVELALTGGADLFGAGVTGLGLTIASLQTADTTDLEAAIATRKALVLPEQEARSWTGDLDYDAIVALRHFVEDGGTIVEFWSGDYSLDLVDGILGTALEVGYFTNGVPLARAAGAAGTPFAGSPDSILSNDATSGILETSLPASARAIYEADGYSTVTVFTKGSGHIVVMGWDFFISLADAPDIQNWVDLLGIAVTQY